MNDAETIATVNNNSEKKRMYFACISGRFESARKS